MNGLLATNGAMPSASYLAAFNPPIYNRAMTSPTRATAMPMRSARAVASNISLTCMATSLATTVGRRMG